MENLLTPALLLNKQKLIANCERMKKRLPQAVALRSHMKTAKSIEVYNLACKDSYKGITVSTLAEAEYFASHGVDDILYAVGIVPAKLQRVHKLISQGCDLKLITDNKTIVNSLNTIAGKLNMTIKLLIEIDCGGERGGVQPDSRQLLEIGKLIKSSESIEFCGLMTHAGQSYHCRSVSEIISVAEQERMAIITANTRLKNELDLNSKILSVGSTPTATFAESFDGLTETRPGVYMFHDIDQYFIGSCQLEDIAVSVLTTVIGHNKAANRLLIDAGALALSKDISASEFSNVTGYGWVADIEGERIQNTYVESVHQEHGLIALVGNKTSSRSLDEARFDFERFPVGMRLRILPIHACMTVAAFSHYHVHDNDNNLLANWSRINHW